MKSSIKFLLLWIGLATLPSMILLSATNQITHSVAPVPFLWLLPLSLYLLSFIFCFSDVPLYSRNWYASLLVVGSFFALEAWMGMGQFSKVIEAIIYLAALFLVSMVCHGELYRSRPDSKHLTSFYLSVSAGGALGGLLVGVIAPRVFLNYTEFFIALVISLGLALYFLRSGFTKWFSKFQHWALTAACLLFVLSLFGYRQANKQMNIVAQNRNFYGIIKVTENNTASSSVKTARLYNGNILHGEQFLSGPNQLLPTSYYVEESGAGMAILNHPKRQLRQRIRVGVVGLGAGTLAAYCDRTDNFRFYEINPKVVEIAQTRFSYLANCPNAETALGDARLSLERELAEAAPKLDVLAIDAFSDDAIPAHLLTKEAVELYLNRLEPNGVLAVHISNRYLDLRPVLKSIAAELNVPVRLVESYGANHPERSLMSVWVLLSRDRNSLLGKEENDFDSGFTNVANIKPWTDTYSNLFEIVKF